MITSHSMMSLMIPVNVATAAVARSDVLLEADNTHLKEMQ